MTADAHPSHSPLLNSITFAQLHILEESMTARTERAGGMAGTYQVATVPNAQQAAE